MCRLSVIILFILFYWGNYLYAASLPAKAFVSSLNKEEVVYVDEQLPNPADGYYEIRTELTPLLGAAPILPPDPGDEVPVGDCLPLVLFLIVYVLCKIKKTRFFARF